MGFGASGNGCSYSAGKLIGRQVALSAPGMYCEVDIKGWVWFSGARSTTSAVYWLTGNRMVIVGSASA